MSVEMKDLIPEDLDALASMQLNSLEVKKSPTTDFDVAIKSYVDGKFSDATNSATKAVTDLIASAPAQLDTLKEIADALGNDANLAAVLTAQISANNTANTTEAVSRASADVVLDGKIDDERSRAASAENLLSIHIQEEVLSRENAVSFEAKERRDADLAIDAKIADETFKRNVALGMEHDFVTNAVSGLDQKVSDEKARSEGAEYGISTMLQEETSARQGDTQNLSMNKMDKSPYYSGGSESHLKVSNDAYLYIGDLWRIRANTSGNAKRLEFQYSADGSEAGFKTAVPFIRA